MNSSVISFIDRENVIYQAILETVSGPIRLFLNNKYVSTLLDASERIIGVRGLGRTDFQSKRRIAEALASKDTRLILFHFV